MTDLIFTGNDLRDIFIACCITLAFALGVAWILAYDSANLTRRPLVKVYCGAGREGHKAEVTKNGERVLEIRCAYKDSTLADEIERLRKALTALEAA